MKRKRKTTSKDCMSLRHLWIWFPGGGGTIYHSWVSAVSVWYWFVPYSTGNCDYNSWSWSPGKSNSKLVNTVCASCNFTLATPTPSPSSKLKFVLLPCEFWTFWMCCCHYCRLLCLLLSWKSKCQLKRLKQDTETVCLKQWLRQPTAIPFRWLPPHIAVARQKL